MTAVVVIYVVPEFIVIFLKSDITICITTD